MRISELTQTLEEDFVWRRREILALTRLLDNATDEDTRLTLMRASLTLYYAHWEGFIKSSSQSYLNFVSAKSKRFDRLSDNFVWVMSKKEIDTFYNSKKNAKDHIDTMISVINRRLNLDKTLFMDKINTESNLKERVLDNICSIIGLELDKSKYEINLICNNLLERRNKVAHGAIIEASMAKISLYRNAVLDAMNEFTYDILDLASREAYLTLKERERREKLRARRQDDNSHQPPLDPA